MNIKKYIVGFLAGIVNGVFGSGGGIIGIWALEKLFKLEPKVCHGTVIALIMPLSIISALIYFRNIEIQWLNVFLVSLGGCCGGYVGARFLKKLSNKQIHRIFGVFMIIGAVRMIF